MNPNHDVGLKGKESSSLYLALLLAGVLAAPGASMAATVTLTDGNSTALVNVDSSAGMYHWDVDGYNQLNQQWFWYRTDAGVQAPINTISAGSAVYSGLNTVTVTYENTDLKLEILYSLTGGGLGSGTADIIESIQAWNKKGTSMDFHLYQYSDFNLLNDPSGDTVEISGNPIDGYDYALQYKGLTQIAEAITSPAANRAEAGLTPSTLNSLNGASVYNLNNSDTAGPGDATWALQWDASIDAGGSFWLFKDKLLSIEPIPEPSTLALIALGLGAWGLARRRQ
jgi:hypothetical protein